MPNEGDICSCKKVKCIRHGNCLECMEHHEKKEQLPRCKRDKSGYKNLFIVKSS